MLILLLACIAFPLSQRLLFFNNTVSQRLPYPFFQTGSEGLILSETALIQTGHSIYLALRPDQFISAPYPPLYYYLVAWLSPANVGQAQNPFLVGRWLSLVAALFSVLAISAGVYATVPAIKFSGWRKLLPVGVSLVVGLCFLSLPAVTIWAARLRADMLMTGFQMVGLALVAWSVYSRRDWPAFLATVPFALAFFTKQTALAGPAAAGVFLLAHFGLKWRKTLLWAGVQFSAIGLPFLFIDWLTGHEFYGRLFTYHNLPWLSTNFETYFSLFLQENAALLVLGGGLLLLTLVEMVVVWRREKFGRQTFFTLLQSVPLALWYWLASLVLLMGLGVSGADHNHFLPAEAANCLVAGTLAMRLLSLPNLGRWLVLLAGLGLWAQANFFSVPPTRYEIEFRLRDTAYQTQMSKIIAYAANAPGPILTNEAGFLAMSGRATQTTNYYNDLFTLAALNKQKLYDQNGLLERVRRKEFSLVLAPSDILNGTARSDVWTPELVAALQENYYRKFADVWYVFEPKP